MLGLGLTCSSASRLRACSGRTAMEPPLLAPVYATSPGKACQRSEGHLRTTAVRVHCMCTACALHALRVHVHVHVHVHCMCMCMCTACACACALHVACACALHVRMCTACAPYVHYRRTACALHAHCMGTACALRMRRVCAAHAPCGAAPVRDDPIVEVSIFSPTNLLAAPLPLPPLFFAEAISLLKFRLSRRLPSRVLFQRQGRGRRAGISHARKPRPHALSVERRKGREAEKLLDG